MTERELEGSHCIESLDNHPQVMISLPVEILRFIIALIVNKRHLASVCLVDHIFLILGRECLYRSIRLVGTVSTVKTCRSLMRNPRLASLVKELIFQPFGDGMLSERMYRGYILPSMLRLFCAALHACSRMQRLSLNEGGSYGWVLQNATFQITYFRCTAWFDSSVVSFLEQQDALLSLHIPSRYRLRFPDVFTAIQSLSPTCCPRLSRVWAPWWYTAALLPHRPVTNFASLLPANQAEISAVLQAVSMVSVPIEALLLTISDVPGPELLRLVACNSSLQSLTIAQSTPFPVLGSPNDHIDEEDNLVGANETVRNLTGHESLQAFASMPDLVTFHYLTLTVKSRPLLEQMGHEMVPSLRKACPSLERVILSNANTRETWIKEKMRGEVTFNRLVPEKVQMDVSDVLL